MFGVYICNIYIYILYKGFGLRIDQNHRGLMCDKDVSVAGCWLVAFENFRVDFEDCKLDLHEDFSVKTPRDIWGQFATDFLLFLSSFLFGVSVWLQHFGVSFGLKYYISSTSPASFRGLATSVVGIITASPIEIRPIWSPQALMSMSPCPVIIVAFKV